jgi:hypothetical protein
VTRPSLWATDGLPDDRIYCTTCTLCDDGTRDGAPSLWCRKFRTQIVRDLPRRCVFYRPTARQQDQRPGSERWPNLTQIIEECRALDAAYASAASRSTPS